MIEVVAPKEEEEEGYVLMSLMYWAKTQLL
jgi:hypothetical protein